MNTFSVKNQENSRISRLKRYNLERHDEKYRKCFTDVFEHPVTSWGNGWGGRGFYVWERDDPELGSVFVPSKEDVDAQ